MKNITQKKLFLGVFFALFNAFLIQAQRQQPPVAITPNVPLYTTTATPNPNTCLSPLPIRIGDVIFIKPGVNIRSQASESSAIVWNTTYDNLDENGRILDNLINVGAIVIGESVCVGGYNWWQIDGLAERGWVAEGRPDRGGYFLVVSGLDFGVCSPSPYPLSAGQSADIFGNIRLRESADALSRVKTVIPNGSQVLILGGGDCVDGVRWWQARATVAGFSYEGWLAEGENGETYLLPSNLPSESDGTLCGQSPFYLAVGLKGFVADRSGTPKALRATPGREGQLLATLVNNVPLEIIGGAVCRDNMNWWQVRVLGSSPLVGWLSEGSQGAGYWIGTSPIDEFAR